MSQFSNLANAAGDTVAEYVNALLGLLGDRDPIAVLAATRDELRDAIADLPEEVFQVPEEDGKWSVAEVLQHLADSEIVWAYRLRRVLSEDRPVLEGYDQDAWAQRFAYQEVPAQESVALFSACRAANLRLLRRLSSSDFDRVGVHAERGNETVRHMLALYAGHDLVHLRQLQRIARRVGRHRMRFD